MAAAATIPITAPVDMLLLPFSGGGGKSATILYNSLIRSQYRDGFKLNCGRNIKVLLRPQLQFKTTNSMKYSLPESTDIADIRGPYTDLNGILVVPFPAQYKRISKVLFATTAVNGIVTALPIPPAFFAILKSFCTSFPYHISTQMLILHNDNKVMNY